MATHYSPKIVTDGLVLCLDAGDKNSYPGSGTTWTDLSGEGNNGTLSDAGIGTVSSSLNTMAFNSAGGNDYISSFSDNISPAGSRTVSCFFKITTSDRAGLCGDRHSSLSTGWVLTVNRTSVGNLTYFHTGGSEIQVAAGISANIWYDACITYNLATATATLYLNGGQIGSPVTSFSAMNTTSFNGLIGGEEDSIRHKMNGNIAQVSIYNRELTAAEVKQNFNAHRHRFGV